VASGGGSIEGYEPADYPPAAVAVDLVLMTVEEGLLKVLLARRAEAPFDGMLALPGGFVRPDEDLDSAAARILAAKAHLGAAWLEQLYTFGDPARDPRMRVIAVAYFGLLPAGRLRNALEAAREMQLVDVADTPPLAFDHARIVSLGRERLRGKLDYAPVAFSLLPEQFTLRDLQDVHEAILGRTLNKPAFRRRMLDTGWLQATGARETGASYRPAALYRFNPKDAPDGFRPPRLGPRLSDGPDRAHVARHRFLQDPHGADDP
jgi:8-oxo-dGTP diphosphatase